MQPNVGFLAFFVVLVSLPVHPFIYEVVVLKRWHQQCGTYQYFIGLSDFHDKEHGANTRQLADIERYLEDQNRATTKVIIEDLSTGPDGGHGSCGQFFINSRGGILGGLAQRCHNKGLRVDNIEYRYCRVASLGPVINNLDKHVHEFPSACGVTVHDIAYEIYKALEEIVNHTGSEVLASCRDTAVQEVQPYMRKLRLARNSECSVADYLQAATQDRSEFLKQLLTFDAVLLDLKLAHSVVTTHDCTNIIAIAGGSHIRRVKEILQEAGYHLVYETPVDYNREYDLRRCKGTNIINGLFCERPEPVDLKILNQFGKAP